MICSFPYHIPWSSLTLETKVHLYYTVLYSQRVCISVQGSRCTRHKAVMAPFLDQCVHSAEKCQYLPEDGSHNVQQDRLQHLADAADTLLYVKHPEIIYSRRPHTLCKHGVICERMCRGIKEKQPTGKV